jgi:8-oxo-dGTP pyrophosphatase MutT (NUDIX family)
MQTSCGVLVTTGTKVLTGIPWGKPRQRDIPKGLMESNESSLQAAIRELREETGLRALAKDLKWVGEYAYRPDKALILYVWYVPHILDTRDMKCSSFFEYNGRVFPEMVDFEWIPFDSDKFYHSFRKILPSVLKDIENLK